MSVSLRVCCLLNRSYFVPPLCVCSAVALPAVAPSHATVRCPSSCGDTCPASRRRASATCTTPRHPARATAMAASWLRGPSVPTAMAFAARRPHLQCRSSECQQRTATALQRTVPRPTALQQLVHRQSLPLRGVSSCSARPRPHPSPATAPVVVVAVAALAAASPLGSLSSNRRSQPPQQMPPRRLGPPLHLQSHRPPLRHCASLRAGKGRASSSSSKRSPVFGFLFFSSSSFSPLARFCRFSFFLSRFFASNCSFSCCVCLFMQLVYYRVSSKIVDQPFFQFTLPVRSREALQLQAWRSKLNVKRNTKWMIECCRISVWL